MRKISPTRPPGPGPARPSPRVGPPRRDTGSPRRVRSRRASHSGICGPYRRGKPIPSCNRHTVSLRHAIIIDWVRAAGARASPPGTVPFSVLAVCKPRPDPEQLVSPLSSLSPTSQSVDRATRRFMARIEFTLAQAVASSSVGACGIVRSVIAFCRFATAVSIFWN